MKKLLALLSASILALSLTACFDDDSGSDDQPATYSVTYDGNSQTSGSVPVDTATYREDVQVTVQGNTGNLQKDGYTFGGWNTAADGSESTMAEGDTFKMGKSNVILYAKWNGIPGPDTYNVIYDANDATSGDVPVDSAEYEENAVVTVLGQGTLERTNYAFGGWNTADDGTGITYSENDTFQIGAADMTLYAKWNMTYTVTYDGNGNDSGTEAPVDSARYAQGASVTVSGQGDLLKAGYNFLGWNTEQNGSGTPRAPETSFNMGDSDVTLYAQWAVKTYSVIYSGNGSTSGDAPVDSAQYEQGATVTVSGKGDLKNSDYDFIEWNTINDGSGTSYSVDQTFEMGSDNVTLYAIWDLTTSTFTADGVSFKMKHAAAGTCPKGTDDTGTITITNPYLIGETEVTYEVYSKVYIWASGDTNVNGVIDGTETAGTYTFSGYPWQGTEDVYTTLQAGGQLTTTSQYPATNISWRDCMIFCNALTEWYNAQKGTSYACVYTSDDTFATPLRIIDGSSSITTEAGTEDNPYVNPNAKGFRLLSADEWELAARYIDGSAWNNGNHVSGDLTYPVYAPGETTSTEAINYAVYYNGTGGASSCIAVKSKLPNALNLYDICGNVNEWSFDWLTASTRFFRGGSAPNSAKSVQIGYSASGQGKKPNYKNITAGTRLAKSAE